MIKVYSPCIGKVMKLEKVDDEVFSQKMLGDGIAVLPQQNEIYSPIDGTITFVYETQHAIGLTATDGTEFLLHIGIDTVMLQGVPFQTQVHEGDHIHHGDLLTKVDWHFIQDKGYDTVTPLIVMKKPIKEITAKEQVTTNDVLFLID